ncbi:hypothetical protein LPJ61_000487 [Coemansia biformis]|uniref:FAS1 domain-containing protein n=1 Tax=Coemansia biformis TaxID=1286918 RepID=A0A9W7YBM0_9FUNG|nr:hypothetical protein LPJ61_000487 [Coemansia biformis]
MLWCRLLGALLLACCLALAGQGLAAARDADGGQGRQPVTFVDLLSSSERFGEFLHTAQRLRMVLPLNRLRNATLFVPTNAALERFWKEHDQGSARVAGSIYRGISDTRAWYHAVGDGVLGAPELAQGATLWESLSRPGAGAAPANMAGGWQADDPPGIMLKTEVTANGRVVVNGVPVFAQNYSCAAGNVYLIDGVLDIPPTIRELLQDGLSVAPDPRHDSSSSSAGSYSAIERLLAVAGWSDVLGAAGGDEAAPQMHTVWAFSNAAFGGQFTYPERAYLLHGATFAGDDDELRRDAIEDVRAVASRYVSGGPISLSRLGVGTHSVPGLGKGVSLEVVVERTQDGGLVGHVDGQPIDRPDVAARNGIVHGVEAMQRPAGLALSPQKVLVGLNATVFVRLLKDAGLGDYIDGARPDRRLTLLAPTNGAMADAFDFEPGDDAREGADLAARLPRDRQREWAQYHIVDGQYSIEELARHSLLRTTLAAGWTGYKAQAVKVQVDAAQSPLSKHVSFNGADNILPEPAVVGNTTIYLLSSPMPTPPRLVNALVQNLDLSLFVAAMGASGTATDIQQWPGVTVLAPVTGAFTSLGLVWSYLSLPGDPDARSDLGRLIRAHVLKRPAYSDEVPMHTDGSAESLVVETLNGNMVGLYRTPHGMFADVGASDHALRARQRQRETDAGASAAASRLAGIADSTSLKISEPDILLQTGVAHVLEGGLIMPLNVDITPAKLLRGMKAHVFVDLLKRFNLTYVLEGPRTPPRLPARRARPRSPTARASRNSADPDENDHPRQDVVGYSLLVPSDKSWNENAAYQELVRRDHDEVATADDGENPWRNSTTADIVHYLDRLVRLHVIPIIDHAAAASVAPATAEDPAGSGGGSSSRLPASQVLLSDRKSYPTLLEDVRLRAHEYASDRFSLQLEGAPFYQTPGGVPFVSVAMVVRSGVARTGAVLELDTLLRLPPAGGGGPGGWRQLAWNAAVWLTGIGMGSGLLGVSGYWVRQWWTRSDYQSL